MPSPSVGPAEGAAAAFAQGQRRYASGQYAEAVEAFSRAQALLPHGATLFNLARCYENLLMPDKALRTYRQALALTKDVESRHDIERRIARLERVPTKVFVSTEPPGARIYVDGEAKPLPGLTPHVLLLRPGSHRLFLEREGYRPVAHAINVTLGEPPTLHWRLDKRAAPCRSCTPCQRCADPRLIDFDGLHLHLSPLGGFMVGRTVGISGGPGVQLYGTAGRFRFGVHAHFMLVNPSDAGAFQGSDTSSSLLMAQVDGGWTFALGRLQLYAVLGLGGYLNRITTPVFDPAGEVVENRAQELGGFLWSLGGGIEVMATRWFSLGMGLRLGLLHGSVYNSYTQKGATNGELEVVNEIVAGPHPYGSLWGSINFHL